MAIIEAKGGTYQDGTKEPSILMNLDLEIDEHSINVLSQNYRDYSDMVPIYYKCRISAPGDYEILFTEHRVPNLDISSGILTTDRGAVSRPSSCAPTDYDTYQKAICFMAGLDPGVYVLRLTSSFSSTWYYILRLSEADPYNEGTRTLPIDLELGTTQTLKTGWDVVAGNYYKCVIPGEWEYTFELKEFEGQDRSWFSFYVGKVPDSKTYEYSWNSYTLSGVRNLPAGTCYMRVENQHYWPGIAAFIIGEF